MYTLLPYPTPSVPSKHYAHFPPSPLLLRLRYLQGLEHKDQETKLREMMTAMEYFVNPQSYHTDVWLKRVDDPTTPAKPPPPPSPSLR